MVVLTKRAAEVELNEYVKVKLHQFISNYNKKPSQLFLWISPKHKLFEVYSRYANYSLFNETFLFSKVPQFEAIPVSIHGRGVDPCGEAIGMQFHGVVIGEEVVSGIVDIFCYEDTCLSPVLINNTKAPWSF